jgi:hypothetical protein
VEERDPWAQSGARFSSGEEASAPPQRAAADLAFRCFSNGSADSAALEVRSLRIPVLGEEYIDEGGVARPPPLEPEPVERPRTP